MSLTLNFMVQKVSFQKKMRRVMTLTRETHSTDSWRRKLIVKLQCQTHQPKGGRKTGSKLQAPTHPMHIPYHWAFSAATNTWRRTTLTNVCASRHVYNLLITFRASDKFFTIRVFLTKAPVLNTATLLRHLTRLSSFLSTDHCVLSSVPEKIWYNSQHLTSILIIHENLSVYMSQWN